MTRSTRQTTWGVGVHEQRLRAVGSRGSALPQRSGFTLIELLVVIVILAMLLALVTPAVFQARRSAQNAAIKAEIDMLHMAMMQYKNEYGSFPPCTGLADARSHVRRLFPRTPSATASPPNITTEITTAPTSSTSLYYWLEGYTKNPTSPVQSGDRVKLFDFDQTRVTAGNQYHPADKNGSPYIYIDASNYGTGLGEVAGFNTDTFQILCNGIDETWNTPDDLSNFWKGTRGDQ